MEKEGRGVIRGYFRLSGAGNGFQGDMMTLIEAGVSSGNLFFEKNGRAELGRLLELSEPGDTILIVRLEDICGRIRELFTLLKRLASRGIGLRSLSEPWFRLTSDALHDGALCELIGHLYDLSLFLSKRQGQAASGPVRSVGRPKGIDPQSRLKMNTALALYQQQNEMSVSEICRQTGLNERTFYRYLNREENAVIRRTRGRKAKPFR